jgi:arylsulfatase A-like enzyme
MMFVGYYNPHSPFVAAPRHRETFRAGTDWEWIQYRPPDFNEENIKDKPAYLEDISPLSPEEVDTAHKQILRSLLSVDDGVATILDSLEQTNLTQNTIVFFISDNGLTLGNHRFGASKNCPYEACLLIPFIVYAPGYYSPRIDTHLVANIDLAPTIAELAGASIPDTVNGLSMVPLLENPTTTWRDEILLEHWPAEEGVGSMIPEFYSIRTAEWKYTEYSTGEVELYDLVNDPYELVNIAGKKDYKDIQSDLAERLQKLKEE